MSASEVKVLHEYDYFSTVYWKGLCTFKENCNKLKTDNSVKETTPSTERTSTEFEQQPMADIPTDTAEFREEAEEGLQADVDVTGESVPDSVQLADGFETNKPKGTTSLNKERLENSNLNKSEQYVACNPAEQKEVNKKSENPDNSRQVENSDVASEQNVNHSIDTNGKSIKNKNDPDKGIQGESDESNIQPTKHIQSAEELHVEAQQEPGKEKDLKNKTRGEPALENLTTDHIQQIRSVSSKDSGSQTSTGTCETIPEKLKISTLIVIITMSSTLAAALFALAPALYLWNENVKVNQELQGVQSQLADISKQLLITNKIRLDKTVHSNKQDWTAEMRETKRRLNEAENKLNQCINTTRKIAKEIEGTKYNLSEAINNTKLEAWTNSTKDKNDTAKYISTNFMSYAKWFPIIGTGLVVELLLVVLGAYLYSKWEKKDDPNTRIHEINGGNRKPRRVNPDTDMVRPMNNGAKKQEEMQGGMKGVLSRIKAKRLQSKVCVLSFYQETSDKHVELTKSAMHLLDKLHGIEVVTTVITKHEEVLDMPPCKVIIMYVDYNQRNVILEDTKKVLGDLKLTTARGILKFNADLVLVYVGHKGSKELGNKDLFSSDITSVQLHPDLREISQKQRFLSVYKQFTKYQKQHLCEILQSDLL